MKNGIETVELRNENPIVSFRLLFRVGSIHDGAKPGITALTAALMARGGTASLTAAELNQKLFPMAAEIDVQVDKELTVFTGRVHRDHLATYLPMFMDVLLAPRFDPKEFERMRADAVADIEKRLRTSDDENLGKAALEWMMHLDNWGAFVGGTVRGLKAMTLDDAKKHARTFFTRDHLTAGFAGGATDTIIDDVTKRLATLPVCDARVKGTVGKPQPRVLIIENGASSTAVSIGHPIALARNFADFIPLRVGMSAFGEHRQSGGRLFERLREKRGLNYGDYAYAEAFVQEPDTTHPLVNIARSRQDFSIWIRPVAHEHAMFALRAALYELDKLLREGLTDDEVKRAGGFLDGFSRQWEAADLRRLGYALDDVFYGTKGYLGELRAQIPSLTAEKVNAAIRRHVRFGDLQIAIVTKDGKKLRDAILLGAPTPITYPTPKSKDVVAEDPKIAAFPLRFKPEEVVVVPVSQLFEN
ncbi:MAG: insulinase family protein [Deltaproteobacteria bacterium]|nr:insulinase family protein [Deltaproteobacteria bacterium]